MAVPGLASPRAITRIGIPDAGAMILSPCRRTQVLLIGSSGIANAEQEQSMARHRITYACGHECEANLVGNGRCRRDYVDWCASGRVCPDCAAIETAKLHAVENVESARLAAALGLPPITKGTEKQRGWAETLRLKRLRRAYSGAAPDIGQAINDKIRDSIPCMVPSKPIDAPEIQDAVNAIIQKGLAANRQGVDRALATASEEMRVELQGRTDARWWIEDVSGHRLWRQPAARLKDRFQEIMAPYAPRLQALFELEEARRRQEAAAAAARRKAEARRDLREAASRRIVTKIASASFRVCTDPGAVVLRQDDLTIRAADGRIARGFVDGGEWVIYRIDHHDLDCMHPGMERIAREAQAVHEAQPATASTHR